MREALTPAFEMGGRANGHAAACGVRFGAGIDELVDMAHAEPGRAELVLVRYPHLACQPSSWGETCLQAASHLGHRRLAISLLEMGIPSDPFVECSLGDPARAVAVLRDGPDVLLGVHRLSILHFAVISGVPEAVERLLAAGASVNPRCASLPPLHSAVACRDRAMVEQLLRAGADPWAVDPFEDTAIDWAAFLEGGGSELVRLLMGYARRRQRPSPAIVLLTRGELGYKQPAVGSTMPFMEVAPAGA